MCTGFGPKMAKGVVESATVDGSNIIKGEVDPKELIFPKENG